MSSEIKVTGPDGVDYMVQERCLTKIPEYPALKKFGGISGVCTIALFHSSRECTVLATENPRWQKYFGIKSDNWTACMWEPYNPF